MSNGGYGAMNGPRVVAYNLSSQTYAYFMRIIELGALEGPLGEMKLNPYLEPVIEALHQVLAGGRVEFKVLQRGNPDIVAELNRRAAEGTAEANQINKDVGFYLTATP